MAPASTWLLELVRARLRDPAERTAALSVAALLPVEKRQELLDELLTLASFGHSLTGEARRVILSLSQDWLLATIQTRAEPFLRLDDHEEYRRMLELFSLIDRDLTLRLAQRAVQHVDPDIREAGEDFIANPTPVLTLEQ